KLGEQAFANSQFPRVAALVEAHAPEENLRGFEWYYLRAVADPEPMTISVHKGIFSELRFSPDSTLLATAGPDGKLRLWDSQTGQEKWALTGHDGKSVSSLAFHPRGDLLASGGYDRMVRLWDVATGRLLQKFNELPSPVFGLAFSPDGRLLAAICRDYTLAVYETESSVERPRRTLQLSRTPVEPGAPKRIGFDNTGKCLIFVESSFGTGEAFVLDVAT